MILTNYRWLYILINISQTANNLSQYACDVFRIRNSFSIHYGNGKNVDEKWTHQTKINDQNADNLAGYWQWRLLFHLITFNNYNMLMSFFSYDADNDMQMHSLSL